MKVSFWAQKLALESLTETSLKNDILPARSLTKRGIKY